MWTAGHAPGDMPLASGGRALDGPPTTKSRDRLCNRSRGVAAPSRSGPRSGCALTGMLAPDADGRDAPWGATSRGVDWGEQSDVDLRYSKMLEVIGPQSASGKPARVLDVGCAYGGLLEYAKSRRIVVHCIGIDLVPE